MLSLLRTLRAKYKGISPEMGLCGGKNSQQRWFESEEKIEDSHAFSEIISLKFGQKCWRQHLKKKKKNEEYFFDYFLGIRLYVHKSKDIYEDL